MSKSNHDQDVEQLQGDLALVRDDLKMTREELTEAQQRIADAKSTISGLNEDLERFRKLQEESAMEVRYSLGWGWDGGLLEGGGEKPLIKVDVESSQSEITEALEIWPP